MSQRRERALVVLAAGAAGAQALLAQSLLVREELLLYGGNEIAVGAFLALWLAGIAVGALAVRPWAARIRGLAVPLLLVQGLLPLLAVTLARLARGVAGIPAYEPFPLTLLLAWTLPVALPVALTTGALVPTLAERARLVGGSVTGIYVAEAVGSLVGGLGATLLLAGGVEAMVLVLGCSAVGTLGAVALVRGRARAALAGAAVALLAVAALAGPSLGTLLRRQHLHTLLPSARLLDHVDTPASALVLAEVRAQQVLMLDGEIAAAFPDPPRAERSAGLLAALSGGPRRLLVIGPQGADLLPGVLTLGALERIVWVIGDPGLRDFALRHVPGLSGDERLQVIVGDPLRRLGTLQRLGPFDAVWLLIDTPLRRADDRFVTRETLQTLADLLAEGGVLAVPVRSAENYVGARLRLALGTVIAGMAEALAEVRLVPGADGLLLGAQSSAALQLDPQRLSRLYTGLRPVQPRLSRESFASLLDPERMERAASLVDSLRRDPDVRPSELDRPLALFHNLVVRAEQESSELTRLLEALRRAGGVLWVPLLMLALFPLGAVAAQTDPARSARSAALAVLAAGGAIGMGLDLLLLHLYQGRFGTLYLEVGWLFGLWMGGLGLGGSIGRRLCSSVGHYALGLATLACLAALAALIAMLGSELLPSRPLGALAFATAGGLSGAVIPVAEALLGSAGVLGARAGAGIEAGDHLGGGLCALGLGVLGIPVVGLAHAAWLVAGLAVFAAACLALALARHHGVSLALPGRGRAEAVRYESFPYRRTMLLLGALASAAVVGHATVQSLLLGPRVQLDEGTLSESGLEPPWTERSTPCIHYRSGAAHDGGLALASRAAARVQGYGGPLNLLVTADPHGRLRRVAFLEHSETPSYVEDADRLFSTLEGMSLLEPIEVVSPTPGPTRGAAQAQAGVDAQRVDAITGATVTSRAIVTALAESGRHLGAPVFGRPYAGAERALELGEPRTLYLIASLLLLLPVFLFGGRWTRRVWLAIHAGVGGIWLGVQLSSVQVLAWLRLEASLDLLSWTGWLAGIVVLAALLGPLYCGYLCPAGALQELLGQLGLAQRMPPQLDRPARFVKYVVLTALIIGSLGFGSESVLRLDLLREAWAEQRSALGLVLLSGVVVGSLLSVRFGCRTLCPTGAFLNLLGKLAPLRRLLPEKRYAACDLGVRGLPDVDCIQCNRCRVGERAEPASAARLNVLRTVLVASLLLLAIFALPSDEGAGSLPSVEPRVRAVDVGELKAGIRSGALSDRRAEYWHVLRPGDER